jgi:prepilin-type N-terminal cleavage/methylation domain-containing protein
MKKKGFISERSEETRPRSGFTLIELLLYIVILVIILSAVSALLFGILQSRVKNQTVAEVEQQGIQVMQIITQTLRNATAISSPGAGASSPTLSINTTTVANNPTVFDLSGGVIRITEGLGSSVALNNALVTASGLTFQNLTGSSTPGTIRITFTLTRLNPSGRNEYDYVQTFYGSATLR